MAMDDDDDRPSGPPPAPEERTWRHPSEVDWTDEAQPDEPAPPRPRRGRSLRPGLWLGLMAALVAGTVVTVTALALVTDLLATDDGDREFEPASTDARAVDGARTTQSIVETGPAVGGVGAAPWFGVDGMDLDAASSRRLGVRGGVVVANLLPGGPAEAAGLLVGDVVVRVHDHPVTTLGELRAAIGHHEPGDVLEVDVIRVGGRVTLAIRLGARSTD